MVDNIIELFTTSNFLPAIYGTAFLLSMVAVFAVKFFYQKDVLTLLTQKESIVKIRVAFIVYTSFVIISKSIENNAILTSYLLFLIFPFGFELLLIFLKKYMVRSVNKDKTHYCSKLSNQIHSRYDTNTGGFYIYPNSQTPKLWAASQAIYGLISTDKTDTSITYSKFVTYCFDQKKTDIDFIFKKNNLGSFKLISNLWTVKALIKIIVEIPLENLGVKNYKAARSMIMQSLSSIIKLELPNNGWAPSSEKTKPADYRLHPTILTLWVLSEIVANKEKLNLSEVNETKAIRILNLSIYSVTENYNKKLRCWSNAPYEEAGKNIGNNSLSLYVFSILVIVKSNLKDIDFSNKESLSKFIKEKHNSMMTLVDNCLLRSIEDNETDGPYDNAVNYNSQSLSITFYDWLPMVILALNATKLSGTYKKSDSFREKRVFSILKNHTDDMKNWYTYRIALLLIAISIKREK